MNQIHGLIRYLEGIKKEYGLRVIIKDFVGFLNKEPALFSYFQDFYIHQNPYCMCIKGKKWDKCIGTKDKLQNRLEKKPQSFYGSCHAGVGEYIIPIVHHTAESKIIGALCVGGFYDEERNIECKEYKEAFTKNSYTIEEIEDKVEVVSEYITMLYRERIDKILQSEIVSSKSGNYVISHAIAYIKNNVYRNVSLDEISEFCHCSHSYLSHHFKDATGLTIKAFAHELRIKEAKELLIKSHKNVSEISEQLGYSDSNYFTKVFKDSVGVSPRNFVKEQMNEENS